MRPGLSKSNKINYFPSHMAHRVALICICLVLSQKMAEKIDFKNGRISNFQGLMTLTLSLDRVICIPACITQSIFTYIPNFSRIPKTFCGWTDRRTYTCTNGRTDIETGFIGLNRRSRPKNEK